MNRLWVRLSIAFAFLALVEVVSAGLLAGRQVATGFRRFVAHTVVQQPMLGRPVPGGLMTALADYYQRNGGWSGVEDYLRKLQAPGERQRDDLRGPGLPDLCLADGSGRVIYDASGRCSVGSVLNERRRLAGLRVLVDGRVVGFVVPEFAGPRALPGPAQDFLRAVNRALLQAGLLAAGLGVILGIVIARSMSGPLSRLAAAARSISRGELHQRVSVEGAHEVAELARAFNEMAAELERAEQLRQNMVADVAHELRTPLSVIRGNLRAILDDVYPLDKAEVAAVYDETLMLARLVDDLRDLANAEAGQIRLERVPIDVAATIEAAVGAFVERANQDGVELVIDAEADLPPACGDAARVIQIIRNLVDNALRHTPAGGRVLITAQREPRDAHFVRICVRDTGSGIAPEQLAHVFDRFWRADTSRCRERGGSGLGLAVAKQLVELQGGRIWAESTEGLGSCFSFSLPVAESPPG